MAFADQFSKEQIEEIFRHGAVGIDLGTTYSAVAAISDSGQIEVLTNSEGRLTTPSVVLFDEDGSTVVGENAKQIGQGQAKRVVECAKRAMGVADFEYEIAGQTYTPVGISAIILGKLVKDASERLGREVKSAVITVPAWFTDDAKQATLRAGEHAELHVLGILSEPTAAALAYGIAGNKGKTALVYDLGGGTFDISIIRISEDGDIRELKREGDVQLGGKDWDQTIIDHFCEAFQGEHKVELSSESDECCGDYMTLTVEAEKAKIRLSEKQETKIFLNCQGLGLKYTLKITRDDFESWTRGLLMRTESTIDVTLNKAGLTPEQIDVVLPVGGSTKMPQVRDLLDRLFPGKADHTVEKDQVVAIGACLYMAKKILQLKEEVPVPPTPPEDDGTKVDVLPTSMKEDIGKADISQTSDRTYGIHALRATDGTPFSDHFVRAGDTLPKGGLTVQKTYGTDGPNQPEVVVRLLVGDSETVEQCREVAQRSCELPEGLPDGSPLHVTFTVTEEGMIKVDLYEPTSQTAHPLEWKGDELSEGQAQAVRDGIRALD